MTERRPLAAGNWKMNGLTANLAEMRQIAAGVAAARCDVLICPPATLIAAAVGAVARSGVLIGGQDCAAAASGAFTGDISAEMIADLGARFVIVGHSERRMGRGETDAVVHAKAQAAMRAGLTAIVCVGETGEERNVGETTRILDRQVRDSIPATAAGAVAVAYEPVWAIGTGLTPTADEIAAAHAHIRSRLAERIGSAAAAATRILYGGSVKGDNADRIAPIDGVDGALVGGASLKAAEFLKIIAAFG